MTDKHGNNIMHKERLYIKKFKTSQKFKNPSLNYRHEYNFFFSLILKQFKDGAFLISLDKLFHFWGLQNEYYVGMTTFWVWANVLMMRSVYCIYTSSDLYRTTEQNGQA